MKNILLLGAGKSATCLIDYLNGESARNGWLFTVADSNRDLVQSKLQGAANSTAAQVDVRREEERRALVDAADLVISMLPPALHILVARDCLHFSKHLLTASYADDEIRQLAPQILRNNLLFLCEMGLDPGIDHMSAVKLIQACKARGWEIQSFKSHTGGLVAPESDNNPWHYKISWNPRNVVLAGVAGAIYKEKGMVKKLDYEAVFESCDSVEVENLGSFASYPNRNSLTYCSLYGLDDTPTFIRTTLRRPGFCINWSAVVKAGLTDDRKPLPNPGITFKEWSMPLWNFISPDHAGPYEFLGLFQELPVPHTARTSADVLQYLLETRLAMRPEDKDMIVMQHELECLAGSEKHSVTSRLVVTGEDPFRTAMAKTVGLPLGIAARLLMQGKLVLRGLRIPVVAEIYDPVLEELKAHGIGFTEKVL
jgi:saccharopine dehydrogenase (NADP+, L-glutamate forming)